MTKQFLYIKEIYFFIYKENKWRYRQIDRDIYIGFPGGSVVKNPPANEGATGDTGSIPGSGTSPGEGNGHTICVTHASILAWKIPWTEQPDGLQSMGSPRVGYDFATKPLPL